MPKSFRNNTFFRKIDIFLKIFYFLTYHVWTENTDHHRSWVTVMWKRKENCSQLQMFGINHYLGFNTSSFVNYLQKVIHKINSQNNLLKIVRVVNERLF